MHNNINQDLSPIRRCLLSIEKKLGWQSANSWQTAHYELLSEKIFEETRIRLSPVTLKRLWGKVDYNSSPSKTTLNTLALFLGYGSWVEYEEFLLKGKAHDEIKHQKNGVKDRWTTFPLKTILSAGVGIICLLIFLANFPKLAKAKKYGPVKFDFEAVTSGLPNTVTFNYDVLQSNADSAFIQQSWNPKLRSKVDISKTYFASTYYYPGYYRAKLLLDTTIVREKDLYITSQGWLGTIDQQKIPLYVDEKAMSAYPGQLQLGKDVQTQGKTPLAKIHFVEDLGISADQDLRVTTYFRNLWSKGEDICQRTRILLLGSEAPLIIPFSIKGCLGELEMYLAGEQINGSVVDLSGHGVDFSDWVKLEVQLQSDKILAIYVNDRLSFQQRLKYPMGKLVGVRYDFVGRGSVKSLHITSEDRTIYQTDF